jgi:hypothetical protein
MVYSRDLFISYGADTFLILNGDTLAATSGIISSVLSDGVTITGNGTTGNELTVDTATVIATKGDLSDYVTIAGTETITGAKTFSNTLTQSGGDVNFDSGTLFVDESADRVGIGTSSPNAKLELNSLSGNAEFLITSTAGTYPYFSLAQTGVVKWAFQNVATTGSFTITEAGVADRFAIEKTTGEVGIGTTSPSEKLEVNGKVKISDLTGTGGNAVYENGGVLGVASDATFKSHIADLDNGIEKILNLKPKYFIDNRNSAFQQLGFYAQEVKSVINEASYPIGNTEYLGINDRAIIAVTVKAIQEQQTIIETQSTEIETLKKLITDLSNRLQILENN